MSDLISRQDAIEAVENNSYGMGSRASVKAIKALPSADITETEECLKCQETTERVLLNKASAEAVTIHEDGTLEVKVPNAHKVGRVLVMDTDSHIGGGLFYPDDAEVASAEASQNLAEPNKELKGSDIIRREDAIEAVCRTRCRDKAKGCPAHSCPVIEEFDALPSAEPKAGEWVEHIGGISHELYYFCDQCYGEVDTNDYNFCPYCGSYNGGDDE